MTILNVRILLLPACRVWIGMGSTGGGDCTSSREKLKKDERNNEFNITGIKKLRDLGEGFTIFRFPFDICHHLRRFFQWQISNGKRKMVNPSPKPSQTD
jgi:hypothetical protein